jgi:23S rRNA (cytidine1920-2'-O)/16S rRNA (cytidine1409-2'-O)-methyltransferase
MEKTNFRYMKPEDINDKIDFASVDVSFISLDKILSPAHELLAPAAQMVCLIKPQFEAGKDKVGKKGVVREPEIHIEVVENVFAFTLAKGFEILHLDYSPIRGPEGNIEYLMHLQKTDIPSEDFDGAEVVAGQFKELIDSTVAAAHKKLDI